MEVLTPPIVPGQANYAVKTSLNIRIKSRVEIEVVLTSPSSHIPLISSCSLIGPDYFVVLISKLSSKFILTLTNI